MHCNFIVICDVELWSDLYNCRGYLVRNQAQELAGIVVILKEFFLVIQLLALNEAFFSLLAEDIIDDGSVHIGFGHFNVHGLYFVVISHHLLKVVLRQMHCNRNGNNQLVNGQADALLVAESEVAVQEESIQNAVV